MLRAGKYKWLIVLFTIGVLFHYGNRETNIVFSKKEGMSVESGPWGQRIAEEVNGKQTYLLQGSLKKKMDFYMADNRQVYATVEKLQEIFPCSVHFYREELLKVERGNIQLEMTKGVDSIQNGDEEVACVEPILYQDNRYYVNLSAIAEIFGFQIAWDYQNNYAMVNGGGNLVLPAKYDLRDYDAVLPARNQGKLGTCWAFASLNALQTVLMPEDEYVLSPDHMSLQSNFNISQRDGGEYTMAMAYLAGWQGPVLEVEDPYADGVSPDGLTPIKHVQEIQIIEGKNYEKIKEAVYKYGGVQSSLYTSLTGSTSRSVYYNAKDYAYCFIGEDKPNHDVVIIGWDDNYPKENFNSPLEGDGAFICLNSWGPRFGENGVFYVSYYDTNIGMHNVVYSVVENVDNYDSIYQSDLCGWVGNLGYGSSKGYFANVYEAKENQSLEAVGFYGTGKNTAYKVYYVAEFENRQSLSARTLVAEGTLENAGYYTISIDEPSIAAKGQKFAFVVEIDTPNSVHPIAVEYAADDTTSTVDLSDGEGYISCYGSLWSNVETEQNCNVCLKVYGKNIN